MWLRLEAYEGIQPHVAGLVTNQAERFPRVDELELRWQDAHTDRPQYGNEIRNADVSSWSAAPVRAGDKQSFGCQVTSIGVAPRRTADSEISPQQAEGGGRLL